MPVIQPLRLHAPSRRDAVVVELPVVLAPMAGVTNAAYRQLCREQGAGLYVCEPSLLGCFPEGEPLSLEMDVFPSLARQGLLRGYVVEGYIRDIGTPESYAQFVRDVKQKRLAEE